LAQRPPASADATLALEASVNAVKQGGPWGFLPLRTDSGQSLGSLKHYDADWNSADTDEVSSSSAAQGDEHPAGSSVCARRMLEMQTSALLATQAVNVSSSFFTFMQ